MLQMQKREIADMHIPLLNEVKDSKQYNYKNVMTNVHRHKDICFSYQFTDIDLYVIGR